MDTSLMAAGFAESYIRLWSLKGEKLRGMRSDFSSNSIRDGSYLSLLVIISPEIPVSQPPLSRKLRRKKEAPLASLSDTVDLCIPSLLILSVAQQLRQNISFRRLQTEQHVCGRWIL
jgi:hypothetical protein